MLKNKKKVEIKESEFQFAAFEPSCAMVIKFQTPFDAAFLRNHATFLSSHIDVESFDF
jgi:hypothetical protein